MTAAMKAYALLALVIAAIGLYALGSHRGHTAGYNQRASEDQKQFDAYNLAIAAQKAEAGRIYQQDQASIIALQQQRAATIHQLEEDHAKAQTETDGLRARLADVGLRFKPAEVAGFGLGGAGALPTGGSGAGAAQTPDVQLPAALAADLRQLQYEADELAADYASCYGFATGVR